MNESTKIETKGFCLYIDNLQAAFEILPTMEERGKLLTNIYQYVSNEKVEMFSERINAVFLFVRNSINVANRKYLKRKEAQKAYNDKRRQEREERQKSEENTENDYNRQNTLDNGQRTLDNGQRTLDNGQRTTDKDIINNISSSTKYTLPEIKERIEKAGYILKENYIKDFYLLNNERFKWKYSPECAILAYVERHPQALKEKSTPQPPAVPRADIDLAKAAQLNEEHNRAVELWQNVKKIMTGKDNQLNDKQKKAIFDVKPLTARMVSFRSNALLLQVASKSDIAILEATPKFLDVVKSCHVSKLEYQIFLSDN
jgi:hypothetical protein